MTRFAKIFSALGITGVPEPSAEAQKLDIDRREAVLTALTLAHKSASGTVGNFVPEILTGPGPHAGPFVQIEGYGGNAVLSAATVTGSTTAWAGKTIYDATPIEGAFSAISLTSGSLIAYKRIA